jgi:threonine dehydrogenase-like Zn-dependent dehydrogenase
MPAIASPAQVRLRILDAGVCGTDRWICSFQYRTPPLGLDYLVIAYEQLGEVVETAGRTRSRS